MGFRPNQPVVSPDDPDAVYDTPFTGKPLAEDSSTPFNFGDSGRPIVVKRYLEVLGHDATLSTLITQVNDQLSEDWRVTITTDNASGGTIVGMTGGGGAVAEVLPHTPSVDMSLKVVRGEYWTMAGSNNTTGVFRDPTSHAAFAAYRTLRDNTVAAGEPFEDQKYIVYYRVDSTHPDDIAPADPGGPIYYSVMSDEGEAMLADWLATFAVNPGIINVVNSIPSIDDIIEYLQVDS